MWYETIIEFDAKWMTLITSKDSQLFRFHEKKYAWKRILFAMFHWTSIFWCLLLLASFRHTLKKISSLLVSSHFHIVGTSFYTSSSMLAQSTWFKIFQISSPHNRMIASAAKWEGRHCLTVLKPTHNYATEEIAKVPSAMSHIKCK